MATRDDKGRFAEGNHCSPGRRPRETERRYLQAFKAALSIKDLRAVIRSCIDAATGGDVQAMRLLLNYALGVPCDALTEARLSALEHGLPATLKIVYDDEVLSHENAGN